MQKGQQKLSVAILYYVGTHEDDEDTIAGVRGIAESLKRTGHTVKRVIVTHNNWRNMLRTPGDVVFNFVEDDTWELYEKVAYGLEKLGRAQVGQDAAGLKYCLEKSFVKKRMQREHITTPNFKIFSKGSPVSANHLVFPVIIKPSNQHAGIGISQKSVVTDAASFTSKIQELLHQYGDEVIAEEYIAGREIHVTVIGNGRALTVLPYCEIWFGGAFKNNWSVYTYQAKWSKKSWEYADARVVAPAQISRTLAKKLRRLAMRAYRVFRCRDIARFDFRVDKNETPYIVDVNMNPSINYYDDQDATIASINALRWTYDEFIEKLIAITYNRLRK